MRAAATRLLRISSRNSSPSEPISTTSPPASRDRTRSSRLSRSAGGRSLAITTWRPASISVLRVWQNSAWVERPLQELQVVDHQHVDSPHRFLERKRGLGAQRRDEAVHEPLGGEIEHFAIAAVVAGPGDRLQQMGFAEPDGGMDIERIEHQRLAAAAGRHLFGRGMGKRVGAADDEAFESEARIERRAAERLMHRHERHAGARHGAIHRAVAHDRAAPPVRSAWLWRRAGGSSPSARSIPAA